MRPFCPARLCTVVRGNRSTSLSGCLDMFLGWAAINSMLQTVCMNCVPAVLMTSRHRSSHGILIWCSIIPKQAHAQTRLAPIVSKRNPPRHRKFTSPDGVRGLTSFCAKGTADTCGETVCTCHGFKLFDQANHLRSAGSGGYSSLTKRHR